MSKPWKNQKRWGISFPKNHTWIALVKTSELNRFECSRCWYIGGVFKNPWKCQKEGEEHFNKFHPGEYDEARKQWNKERWPVCGSIPDATRMFPTPDVTDISCNRTKNHPGDHEWREYPGMKTAKWSKAMEVKPLSKRNLKCTKCGEDDIYEALNFVAHREDGKVAFYDYYHEECP